MNKTVLNIEWGSKPSRDITASSLICNYLKHQGIPVIRGSIFESKKLIEKHEPEVVFISNAIGAIENFETVLYAKEKGLKVITGISEGNFKERVLDQMIWGWNKYKDYVEDVHVLWSNRTKSMITNKYPSPSAKLKVGGGSGFDLYKLKDQESIKSQLLKKHGFGSFSKTIGVGCWDFGPYYKEDNRYDLTTSVQSPEEMEGRRKDGRAFNAVLLNTINDNPDILFIIKEHPGRQLGPMASGIVGLKDLPNTLVLQKEESISDVIAASDFWLVYESTTALEAWLFNKQTCLLNPTGVDFFRDEIYLGSPNYPDENKLQEAINSFYSTGELINFKDNSNYRTEAIRNVIEWGDGLNHVRTGNEIINLINTKEIKPSKFKGSRFFWSKRRILQALNKVFPSVYKPLNKYPFDHQELAEYENSLWKSQSKFYLENNLDKDGLTKITAL